MYKFGHFVDRLAVPFEGVRNSQARKPKTGANERNTEGASLFSFFFSSLQSRRAVDSSCFRLFRSAISRPLDYQERDCFEKCTELRKDRGTGKDQGYREFVSKRPTPQVMTSSEKRVEGESGKQVFADGNLIAFFWWWWPRRSSAEERSGELFKKEKKLLF